MVSADDTFLPPENNNLDICVIIFDLGCCHMMLVYQKGRCCLSSTEISFAIRQSVTKQVLGHIYRKFQFAQITTQTGVLDRGSKATLLLFFW